MEMNQRSAAGLPASILNSRGVPMESAGPAREVTERVRRGRAFLKIVETLWEVEFYIVDMGAKA